MIPIAVRTQLSPLDEGYVIDSWRSTLKHSAWAKVAGAYYLDDHTEQVIRPLLRAGSWAIVHPATDENFILCWAVAAGDTLHYVCTRRGSYARQGFARIAVMHLPETKYFSFKTESLDRCPWLTEQRIYRPYRNFTNAHAQDQAVSARHEKTVSVEQDANGYCEAAAGLVSDGR